MPSPLHAPRSAGMVPAMDLRSFKIHRPDRHVRAVLGDHRGEHAHDLYGEAFERVVDAALPLLDILAARAGAQVRALSVDGIARVLRLTTAEMPPRPLVLDGHKLWDMSAQVAPLARAVLRELHARSPDLPGTTPSDADFWDHIYRDEAGGWELGRATPPLAGYFAAASPRGLRALVVGCGRGHEARMLAALGAHVTAIDIAPTAIATAQASSEPGIDYLVQDLFTMPREPERFDVVVEHTCYCAIEVSRRDEYVDAVADLLVPGGQLVGLFFAHGRPGGPPFTVDAASVRAAFERRFTIDELVVATDSVLVRMGEELLARFAVR